MAPREARRLQRLCAPASGTELASTPTQKADVPPSAHGLMLPPPMVAALARLVPRDRPRSRQPSIGTLRDRARSRSACRLLRSSVVPALLAAGSADTLKALCGRL